MSYFKFVDNIEEIELFWRIVLAPQKETELISLSLSVREKLLNEQERKLFPEYLYAMFQRRSVYGTQFVDFARAVYSYETNKLAFTSIVDGVTILPEKAMRIYVNVNRTDGKVIPGLLVGQLCKQGFAVNAGDVSGRAQERLIKLCIKGGDKLIQQNQNVKEWADYDIDFEEMPENYGYAISSIRDICLKYLKIGTFLILSSPSGLHILVRNGSFACNPQNMLDDIKVLPFKMKEVGRNKNNMLILPGTVAYNANKEKCTIEILNKYDFI